MGKDWFYWGGGAAGRSSSSKKGRQSRKQLETSRHDDGADDGAAAAAAAVAPAPSGCMCAVLQIFDLPHFHLAFNHHHRSLNSVPSLVPDHHFQPTTGLEAPRNSLELEEPKPATSTNMKLKLEEEGEEAKNLNNISVGINQIRTSCDSRPSTCKPRIDDFSSECSSSPGGSKTPNLVARLMGLDLLPENASPTFTSSRKSNLHPKPDPVDQVKDRAKYLLQQERGSRPDTQDRGRYLLDRRGSSRSFSVLDNADISGSLSLPETPRISLARKSDVDHHHRLSLQINKENIMGEEFDQFTSSSSVKRVMRNRRREVLKQVDENITSPSYYARQIVKQVKESVSRKVGVDITNNKEQHHRKKHLLDTTQVVLLKPNKPSIILSDDDGFSTTKHQSCSPRFRFLEPKTAKPPPPSPNAQPPPHQKVIPKQESCKENHCPRRKKQPPPPVDAIRSKKEEPFVRPAITNHHENNKKCKRGTPLSSELLNPNNVATILPAALKKLDRPSPPTKLPHKQSHDDDVLSSKSSSQLSSCTSQWYKQQQTTAPTTTEEIGIRSALSGNVEADYIQYVQRILKRTGIVKDSSVSLAKWYSSSHPLDPSIFHYIELFHHHLAVTSLRHSPLRLRSNRKLTFQLVDELLVGILKPCLDPKPWVRPCRMNGSELTELLCRKIRNLPSANCLVLEDIDKLIGLDLESMKGPFDDDEEEEAGIVVEIERGIVESLVHETATVVLAAAGVGSSVQWK